MIIDTHTHLLDKSFDADRETIIETLKENNFSVIENAISSSEWGIALTLAEKHPNFFVSLGIHPHDAKSATAVDFETLAQLLTEKKVVAVGETGLDYYYKNSFPDTQKQIFIKQIELSFLHNKPLIVHCRDAYDDTFSILEKFFTGQKYKGVVHCFSGTLADAERFVNIGFYIGIDGPLTYPKAKKLREVIEKMPLENMLVETDCPYLPPQNFRGKRNEPGYIKYIIDKIAEIKKISFETVAEVTAQNAKNLFKI